LRILLQGDDRHPFRRYPEFAVHAANISRGPTTTRQWLLDGLLALAAFGGTIALEAHGLGSSGSVAHRLDPIGVVLAGCTSLPLVMWRRAPLAGIRGRHLGQRGTDGPRLPGGAAGRADDRAVPAGGQPRRRPAMDTPDHDDRRRHVLRAHPGVRSRPRAAAGDSGRSRRARVALAWFAGERTRLRRQEIEEIEQRAIQAERDAIQDRRLALAEERTRIARDLHDSAAHAINVIAVQAGAARLWHEQDPARSRAALETIEAVARRTVAEIDQIVHSLREDTPPTDKLEPPAGLAALDSLLAQHDAAGLTIT